ncbi:MOSC domain-containing protein [Photobacterium leiognathi subsp. mandapamensis]|uniref:MOSC domain-containing protein n=1 Tax=Photobacterium leiognathi TaxID=553611 RepID=UPI000D16AE3B|nr:MOSC domain-containing protein [Photobacterium leiognathi]PSV04316.1 MOSC domain-containing protein [Photobacterium leiognathi subsp. mandapamensis]
MYPVSNLNELRLGKVKSLYDSNTAIDKHTVDTCDLSVLGLAGDEQAESFHGGEDRAVLQYDFEHYADLAEQFPESTAYFVKGGFGENFVATGMNEHNMCIGDIVKVGSVVLQVTQPRQPCFKLNSRFSEPTLSRYVQDNFKTGWFYRVLQTGTMNAGDTIEVTERLHPEWTVAKVQHYLYVDTENKTAMQQLVDLDVLAKETKGVFERRLQNNVVENWTGRLIGKRQ